MTLSPPSTPRLVDTAYPLGIGEFTGVGYALSRMTGTGFIPAPGVLVSCAHCLPSDGELAALVPRPDGTVRWFPITDVVHDPVVDLACGRIDVGPLVQFSYSDAHVGAGLDVSCIGHPLMHRERIDGDLKWRINPRVLKGYITREFSNDDHPGVGPQPSYELDMPAPAGASGSPLMTREGPLGTVGRLVGVVYGSHDSFTIAEEATIDPDTGESTAEVRRYVSFGLAHQMSSLAQLSGPATDGRPLREVMTGGAS